MQTAKAAWRRSASFAVPRAVTLVLAMLALGTPAARAQIGSERYAAIVTDAQSGNVLIGHSQDELRHPASLTKMMTLYMAFEALRDGRIQLNSPIPVSENAASMAPSRIGLVPGMTITVEEAVLALVTKSANDAAAALGEYLAGGSEYRFAQMMTLKARSLGMSRTVFRNASGLPDPDQVSTARDMALLGRRLIQDFPDRYGYFATPHFRFRGRVTFNHNRLLQEYEGADGIKTGYVNDSGFNLVASARRDGVRLVAAVFGGRSGHERDRHMMALLDQGFAQLGVAPRQVMAARRLPRMMGTAQAATAPQRSAPRPAATASAGYRQPSVRLTASKGMGRPATRVEQGDTSRNNVLRLPSRHAAPKPQPVAQRPVKATKHRRR